MKNGAIFVDEKVLLVLRSFDVIQLQLGIDCVIQFYGKRIIELIDVTFDDVIFSLLF